MKKIMYVLLFAIILCNSVFAQSGWVLQNPYPTGSMLFGVKFLNDNTGYFVGDGIIMKSTNGGQSVIFQNSPVSTELNSVWFTDANTGIIAGGSIQSTGNDGVILRTINGGNSWSTVSSGLPMLWSVCFLNANTGFICGKNGTLLKTVNAGLNWTIVNSATTVQLWGIDFIDDMTGFITGGTFQPNQVNSLGDGLILKTTNGGTSWSSVLSGYNNTLFGISFANQNTGYAGGADGAILKTTNGGTGWSPLNSGSNLYFFGLYASDQNIVSVCGASLSSNGGRVLRTTNGGTSWSCCLNPSDTNSFYLSVQFHNTNTGFAVGNSGKIIKTVNGGANWSSLSSSATNYDIEDMYFIGDVGYAIANDDPMCQIIKTTNGGNAWTLKSAFNNLELREVFFNDVNTGYVCGRTYYPSDEPNDTGIVLKTTNGGNSWSRNLVTGTSGNSFYNIYFTDYNTGYAMGGGNQYAFKTTNGGNSWTNFNIAFNYCGIMTSGFVNANTGFIGGCMNVGRTTDGGTYWSVFSNVPTNDILSVFAVNSNTVFAAGYSNIISRSTSGGSSWNAYPLSPGAKISELYFVNSNIGYASGYDVESNHDGKVYATTNGGNSWSVQQLGSCPELNTVFFVNANTGYAGGKDGAIYKTTTGGIGITNISTEVPSSFSLHQNYPNPFNPTTNIRFDVQKSGNISIKVFDVLGREIATLVNEQLKPGTYEVDFDGSNFTSGVYFYKLTTNGYIESKKMLMIK